MVFDFNESRTNAAAEKINQYGEIARVNFDKDKNPDDEREKYSNNMARLRQSPYYLDIKRRIDNQQSVVPAEYMYYALTTDNVSTLDLQSLREISDYYHYFAFSGYIRILICALKCQEETNPAAKADLHEQLKNALYERRCANKLYYLNLRGVNLSEVILDNAELNYSDLTCAKFSKSNMFSTEFRNSILDHADFSDVSCQKYRYDGVYVYMYIPPAFESSSIRFACFDRFNQYGETVEEPAFNNWRRSDFSGSSFRQAKIVVGSLEGSKFDFAIFADSVIKVLFNLDKSISMEGASLVRTSIQGIYDFDWLKPGIKILSDDNMHDPLSFKSGLYAFYSWCSNLVMADTNLIAEKKGQMLLDVKDRMAACILNQVSKSDLTDREKADLLSIAIGEDVFKSDDEVERSSYYNKVPSLLISGITQLFADNSRPTETRKLAAAILLENERDRLDTRIKLSR